MAAVFVCAAPAARPHQPTLLPARPLQEPALLERRQASALNASNITLLSPRFLHFHEACSACTSAGHFPCRAGDCKYPKPAADDRNTCWCLPIPYQPFPSGDGNQAFPPSENSSNATMRLQIEDTCPAEYEPCPTSESQPPLGCLFNLTRDASERHDLSSARPAALLALRGRLERLAHTRFQTDWADPQYSRCVPFSEYVGRHAGFAGPVCER